MTIISVLRDALKPELAALEPYRPVIRAWEHQWESALTVEASLLFFGTPFSLRADLYEEDWEDAQAVRRCRKLFGIVSWVSSWVLVVNRYELARQALREWHLG